MAERFCTLTSKEISAKTKQWVGVVIPADGGKNVALQTKHSEEIPSAMFYSFKSEGL